MADANTKPDMIHVDRKKLLDALEEVMQRLESLEKRLKKD
jgi:hypothetical protein